MRFYFQTVEPLTLYPTFSIGFLAGPAKDTQENVVLPMLSPGFGARVKFGNLYTSFEFGLASFTVPFLNVGLGWELDRPAPPPRPIVVRQARPPPFPPRRRAAPGQPPPEPSPRRRARPSEEPGQRESSRTRGRGQAVAELGHAGRRYSSRTSSPLDSPSSTSAWVSEVWPTFTVTVFPLASVAVYFPLFSVSAASGTSSASFASTVEMSARTVPPGRSGSVVLEVEHHANLLQRPLRARAAGALVAGGRELVAADDLPLQRLVREHRRHHHRLVADAHLRGVALPHVDRGLEAVELGDLEQLVARPHHLARRHLGHHPVEPGVGRVEDAVGGRVDLDLGQLRLGLVHLRLGRLHLEPLDLHARRLPPLEGRELLLLQLELQLGARAAPPGPSPDRAWR